MVHQPRWFKKSTVLIINAPTCGINKDGHEQYIVDPGTGTRIDEIDDKLSEYVEQITNGKFITPHVNYKPLSELKSTGIFVPAYYDNQSIENFEQFIQRQKDLESISLEGLKNKKLIKIFGSHGSPSQDQRVGDVAYIKVSDLRAGHVNINPTNMIPLSLAKKYWRGKSSGLQAFDLISPERASKNIGEYCVLMPGQERIVLTKEVICIRALQNTPFDQFYLMWALSLKIVRQQWNRIVFMQTNREDVGNRVNEIRIPYPKSKGIADSYAKPFKEYYKSLEGLRSTFTRAIKPSGIEHHIFLD